MRFRSQPRRGITLTEVLIAIFVMAIGLLGILSLFPLGFVQMAQAIKDDRCATANNNATTLARQSWHDELARPYLQREPYIHAMLDPNAPWIDPTLPAPANGPNPFPSTIIPAIRPIPGPFVANPYYQIRKPSYPVFLDPVGWNNPNNVGTAQQWWVGADLNCIPRRSVRRLELAGVPPYPLFPTEPVLLNRGFVLMDDLGFGRDGTPYNSTGTTTAFQTGGPLLNEIQRDGRFSWAYMLKQPQWSPFLASTVNRQADLFVIVYMGRSLDGPSDERVLDGAIFTAGSTEVIVPYAAPKPRIRKGTWILDGTMTRQQTLPNGTVVNVPEPHGHFYRVINVNDDTPGVLILEIQQPAQASTTYPNGNSYGKCVLLDFVAEVFERRTLTDTTVPVP